MSFSNYPLVPDMEDIVLFPRPLWISQVIFFEPVQIFDISIENENSGPVQIFENSFEKTNSGPAQIFEISIENENSGPVQILKFFIENKISGPAQIFTSVQQKMLLLNQSRF